MQLLEAWVPLAKGQKRQKSGQQNKAIIGSSPILYTQSALSAGKNNLFIEILSSGGFIIPYSYTKVFLFLKLLLWQQLLTGAYRL